LSEPYLHNDVRQILENERNKIEHKLSHLPIVLSMQERLDMQIVEKQDWTEDRHYERMFGSTTSPILGHNNIGWIHLSGSSIIHTLYTIKDGMIKTQSSTVSGVYHSKN
jgi:hypothetical protein